MTSAILVNSYGSCAFECAVAETQGHRDSYEDAHVVAFTQQSVDMWLLDGHHGASAARLGAPALSKEIGPAIKGDKLPSRDRISQSFRAVDNQLRQALKDHPDDAKAGSTVVGFLATKQGDGNYSAKLINCGDSRGVVIKSPMESDSSEDSPNPRSTRVRQQLPVIIESIDHKPSHPEEKARIEAAGGRVCGDRQARIDGKLAVSRGLGDFKYKSDRKRPAFAQKVTCAPDVYEISDLQPGTLVVLACDGLWDVMRTKDVASFVSSQLHGATYTQLTDVARNLVSESLKRKSHDNITVLLALLGPMRENDSA